MDKILSGKDGEEKACNYVKSKKYSNALVIIEVKYRKSVKFGKGYEAVNYTKQQKIIKTAQHYINENNIKMPVRFDVISIDDNKITHIENAFGV